MLPLWAFESTHVCNGTYSCKRSYCRLATTYIIIEAVANNIGTWLIDRQCCKSSCVVVWLNVFWIPFFVMVVGED